MTRSERAPGGLSARMVARLGRLLEQNGIDPREVFGVAAKGALEPRPGDRRVPYSAVDQAIECSARRLGAAGLGLALARVRDDEAYGAAGLLLAVSGCFREGLSRAFVYQRLWGDGERFALRELADGYAVTFRHPGESTLARAVLAECAIVELIESARTLVTPSARPVCVEFMHGSLGPSEELGRYLGVAPAFNRPENAVVFDAELMDRPLALRRELLRAAFERQCWRAVQQFPAGVSVAQRVGHVLAEVLDGRVDIADVAARLRMSRRTLQRKLRAEGTSFQQVLDDLRRRRAKALIDGGSPKKEAALRLGYSDPSGLLRARRRWRRAWNPSEG